MIVLRNHHAILTLLLVLFVTSKFVVGDLRGSSHDNLPSSSTSLHDPKNSNVSPHQNRKLMSDMSGGMGGGGGGSSNNDDLEQSGITCFDFESDPAQDAADQASTDEACKTNSCDGGCCRFWGHGEAYLVCDSDNTYSHLVCVCNGNTNNTHVVDRGNSETGESVDVGGPTPTPPPAQAGDCDVEFAWGGLPPSCTRAGDCTQPGHCCVAHFCFCKIPDPNNGEVAQCVPDP